MPRTCPGWDTVYLAAQRMKSRIADDMGGRIRRRRITAADARQWAGGLRFQASLLFPDRMDTYDRIYGARFERLILQFLTQGA